MNQINYYHFIDETKSWIAKLEELSCQKFGITLRFSTTFNYLKEYQTVLGYLFSDGEFLYHAIRLIRVLEKQGQISENYLSPYFGDYEPIEYKIVGDLLSALTSACPDDWEDEIEEFLFIENGILDASPKDVENFVSSLLFEEE